MYRYRQIVTIISTVTSSYQINVHLTWTRLGLGFRFRFRVRGTWNRTCFARFLATPRVECQYCGNIVQYWLAQNVKRNPEQDAPEREKAVDVIIGPEPRLARLTSCQRSHDLCAPTNSGHNKLGISPTLYLYVRLSKEKLKPEHKYPIYVYGLINQTEGAKNIKNWILAQPYDVCITRSYSIIPIYEI